MATIDLHDFELAVGARRYAASVPEPGDLAHLPDEWPVPDEVTIGVLPADAKELQRTLGAVARLLDDEGNELYRLRIEEVDPQLNVVVGRLVR